MDTNSLSRLYEDLTGPDWALGMNAGFDPDTVLLDAEGEVLGRAQFEMAVRRAVAEAKIVDEAPSAELPGLSVGVVCVVLTDWEALGWLLGDEAREELCDRIGEALRLVFREASQVGRSRLDAFSLLIRGVDPKLLALLAHRVVSLLDGAAFQVDGAPVPVKAASGAARWERGTATDMIDAAWASATLT